MEQPTLFTGRELGAKGQTKVLDKEVQAWKTLAEIRVRRLASSGLPFTIEDVYDTVGRPPRHFNSAGALLGSLARSGAPIVWSGMVRPATTPSRHGGLIRVWIGKESAR